MKEVLFCSTLGEACAYVLPARDISLLPRRSSPSTVRTSRRYSGRKTCCPVATGRVSASACVRASDTMERCIYEINRRIVVNSRYLRKVRKYTGNIKLSALVLIVATTINRMYVISGIRKCILHSEEHVIIVIHNFLSGIVGYEHVYDADNYI